jgi:hypothetical protein
MTVIQHRRGTTAEWAASSYILEAGEIGVELDTTTTPDTVLGIKVGNGESLWGVLDYVGGTADGLLPAGGTTGQLLSKIDGTDYNATWVDQTSIQTSTVKHLVKNDSGVTLTKGTVVYTKSANGTNILVDKAIATNDQFSSQVLGFLESDLEANATGYCINNGLVTNINTNGATAGDPVWLSPDTAGAFVTGSSNKPSAPDHLVYLGVVTRANTNTGEIFVHISNGWELEELHNVAIDTPADNEVLAYDSTSGLWKNQTASEAGLATPSDIATAIANLVDSAPTTLDTLNELAAALGDDANFATTVTDALALKQPLDSDLTAIAALTSTGILKRTGTDTWTLITDNSSNWDSAYGWGNHASAGYLTTTDATSTYLTQANAASTYLTQSNASSTYLTQSNAASTYAALSGATFTGPVESTHASTWSSPAITIGGAQGAMLFKDTDSSQADAIIGANGGSFFILGDTDSDGAYNTEAFKINLTSGLVTLIGQIAANGGIAGAAAKNMTVSSLMPSAGTASTGVGVIMTAAATGASAPTKRPNGDNLATGDVWISW